MLPDVRGFLGDGTVSDNGAGPVIDGGHHLKAPAFQLYAGDYFVDTVFWSNEEVGLYTRLLLLEWATGPLTSDHKRLAQGVGFAGHNWRRDWDRLWATVSSKFSQISLIKVSENSHNSLNFLSHLSQYDASFLVNIRLETTRGKQFFYSESRRKGAIAKHEKERAHADAHAAGMHVHKGYSPSPTPSPSSRKKQKITDAPSPDVKVAIDYFVEAVQVKKGFTPQISGGKDAALVKKALKHGIDHVKKQIDFFLSNGKSQEHITLAAALSADTYNLFMSKSGKKEYLGGVAY